MTVVSSKLVNRYGNMHSGIMAQTLPKPDAKVGDEATILNGRDRAPAKVVEIRRFKNNRVAGFVLQEYKWTQDAGMVGTAKEIHWDQPVPAGNSYHPVVTHGRFKGTVKDAYIGSADPFYDHSF